MSNALSQLSYYKQNFSFCRELNISICPVSKESEHVSGGWEAGETEPQKVKPALTGMEWLLTGMEWLLTFFLEGHFGSRDTGIG